MVDLGGLKFHTNILNIATKLPDDRVLVEINLSLFVEINIKTKQNGFVMCLSQS